MRPRDVIIEPRQRCVEALRHAGGGQ
jgi:hypothetical protein